MRLEVSTMEAEALLRNNGILIDPREKATPIELAERFGLLAHEAIEAVSETEV